MAQKEEKTSSKTVFNHALRKPRFALFSAFSGKHRIKSVSKSRNLIFYSILAGVISILLAASYFLVPPKESYQIEAIEREKYSGVVILIEDPSRIFLGTSTPEGFSRDIPGRIINEMFELYPEAIAAVNAGRYYDDGTSDTIVGSVPLGLTVSNGKIVWSEMKIWPALECFVGFNSDDKLIVFDYVPTPDEAKALKIRDGVCMDSPMIVNGEVMPPVCTATESVARTAIGQREDGTVILLCINGSIAFTSDDYFDYITSGATYEDVVSEMLNYGAVNACLMMGSSNIGMMYRADTTQDPQLLTNYIFSIDGDQKSLQRRMPTYWMITAE